MTKRHETRALYAIIIGILIYAGWAVWMLLKGWGVVG